MLFYIFCNLEFNIIYRNTKTQDQSVADFLEIG